MARKPKPTEVVPPDERFKVCGACAHITIGLRHHDRDECGLYPAAMAWDDWNGDVAPHDACYFPESQWLAWFAGQDSQQLRQS